MKKKILVMIGVLLVCFTCSMVATPSAWAGSVFDPKAYGLEDGYVARQEMAGKLKGVGDATVRLVTKRDGESPYENAVALEILPRAGKAFCVRLPGVGGYRVRMDLKSFVSASVSEVFLAMDTGGSGGWGAFYVIEVADSKPRFLFDSNRHAQLVVEGRYLDDYRCEFLERKTKAKAVVNLGSRKALYDEMGIYDPTTGKLLKPMKPFGGLFSNIVPVDYDKDGLYGLQGSGYYDGVSRVDRLVTTVFTFHYSKGKWKPLGGRIFPAEGLSLVP